MNQIEAINIFERNGAIKQGHFVLLGGDHSEFYIDKNKVLMNSAEAIPLYKGLTKKLVSLDPDVIIGPQMGGALMAPWIAYYLSQNLKHKILSLYAEKQGNGFKIKPQDIEIMRYKRIVIIDDIFQRGTSVGRIIKAINEVGGTIVGIGVLWKRSAGTLLSFQQNRNGNDIKFVSLITMQLFTKRSDAKPCPLCKSGEPINTDLGYGKEFLEKNKDKLFVCPACGGIADWINKAAGIFRCRKCHAVPAGVEFD